MVIIASLSVGAFALLLAAGALGLVWRRLSDLSLEVRLLRQQLAASPVQQREQARAAFALAEGGPPATLWPEKQTRAWPLDEPQLPLPLERLLPDLGATPTAPARDVSPEAIRAIAAALALSIPALALIFGAPPLWVGAAAYILIAATFALSLQTGWAALAWVGALGGGAWAVWAVQPEVAPWSAAGLAGGALVALTHAAVTRNPGPGGALTAFAAFAVFLLAASEPNAGPALASLGAILAASALVGGGTTKLEVIHVGAFLGACGALLLLGGQPSAQTWFAPAATWSGTLFLGIAAVRAPILGPQAVTVSATGVLAPILAAMSLHTAEHGLGEPWAAAAALVAAAGAFAAILAANVRSAGGLTNLGLAAAPLMLGAPSALALAASLSLSTPLAAAAFAAIAALLMRVDQIWPHPLWRFGAVASGLFGVAAATATGVLIGAGLEDWAALAATAAGLVAPAAFFALAASLGQSEKRAPFTAALLEAAALVVGLGALTALIRWVGADGAPATPAIGFAEAGLHAATWGAVSLLLTVRRDRGAQTLRRGAATALGVVALAIMALGPLGVLNPVYGLWPDPAEGVPLANMLLVGFLLPTLIAAAYARFWPIKPGARRFWIPITATGVLALAWAFLEIRRAFHGADLSAGAIGGWEWAAYAALIALAGGLAVQGLRPRLQQRAQT